MGRHPEHNAPPTSVKEACSGLPLPVPRVPPSGPPADDVQDHGPEAPGRPDAAGWHARCLPPGRHGAGHVHRPERRGQAPALRAPPPLRREPLSHSGPHGWMGGPRITKWKGQKIPPQTPEPSNSVVVCWHHVREQFSARPRRVRLHSQLLVDCSPNPANPRGCSRWEAPVHFACPSPKHRGASLCRPESDGRGLGAVCPLVSRCTRRKSAGWTTLGRSGRTMTSLRLRRRSTPVPQRFPCLTCFSPNVHMCVYVWYFACTSHGHVSVL